MSDSQEAQPLRYLLDAEISDVEVTAIARLHCQALRYGFLSRVGERFLTLLYGTMRDLPDAILVAASQGDRLVGFVSGTVSTGGLYRAFLRRHLFRGGLILLPHLLSLGRLRRVLETLAYPFRKQATTEAEAPLPAAELLSIAVAEDCRGTGIAPGLYRRLCQEFERRQVPAFRIVVGAGLAPARRFYAKMGAREARIVTVHQGEESLILVHYLALAQE
jgi:ribosomal protein S18 acetylase RimI-like enzyme